MKLNSIKDCTTWRNAAERKIQDIVELVDSRASIVINWHEITIRVDDEGNARYYADSIDSVTIYWGYEMQEINTACNSISATIRAILEAIS